LEGTLNEPAILFEKVLDDAIDLQIARLQGPPPEETAAPPAPAAFEALKDEIGYDDFSRLDLRMGTVLSAEAVPRSDKLLRLEVDLGFERRQILAGVAQQMAPGALVGRRVVVVANLKPRKLFGLESRGMLLMAEDRDGRLWPLSAEGESGAVVR
jgi:methionyl-tRNA synthetase